MRTTALLLAIVLVPSTAVAQEIARSFDELVLNAGDHVRITYAFERGGLTYIEAEGNVVRLTDSAITVRFRSIPAGTTDLEMSAAGNDREIEIPENRTRRIGYRPDDPVWNGLAIGAGVGAGIDALRRPEHQLVYLAPGSTVSPFTFAVSPLLSKGQKGLLFTSRW